MRKIISRIVGDKYIRYDENGNGYDENGNAVTPIPVRRTGYGEGTDYFHGATPSSLKQLDNRQLFMAANRLHTTLSEGRGTSTEISHARDAYDSIIREARGRRATLHDERY